MTGSQNPDSSEQLDVHERWVTAVLAEARARDRAPSDLRARLADQERSAARQPSGRRAGSRWGHRLGPVVGSRPVSWGGGAVAMAAVLLAVVFALPGGAPAAPSVSSAAALATRGPAGPAPATDPADPARLALSVGNLAFPSWTTRSGSGIAGARTDRLGGRRVVTVFYEVSGRRVAYSIVAKPTLSAPHGRALESRGYWFQIIRRGGRTILTWTERGHTCIVSAAGVGPLFLQRLVTG